MLYILYPHDKDIVHTKDKEKSAKQMKATSSLQ